MDHIYVTNHDALGSLWFVGWLFTIGYLHLSFWRGVLAIIVWPYFLGKHFAKYGGVRRVEAEKSGV